MIEHYNASISDLIIANLSLKKVQDHYLNGDLNELTKLVVSPFQRLNIEFNFHHPADLKFNEVYTLVQEFFDHKIEFPNFASALLDKYEREAVHGNIKNGDFLICNFGQLLYNNDMVEGVAIFKIDNKVKFLEAELNAKQSITAVKDGIDLNKIDKCCLIIKPNGDGDFIVLNREGKSNSEYTQFWFDRFLGLKAKQESNYLTRETIKETQAFVKAISESIGVNDQVEILEKSQMYLVENDQFDIKEYCDEVFANATEDLKNQFEEYLNPEILNAPVFDISKDIAAKENKKSIKTVKLDENFRIIITGGADKLEKGIDENGRKYYKLYYEEEL